LAVGEWVVTMTSFTVRPITNLKNDYTFMCSRLSVGRLDLKHSSSFESTPVTSGSSTPDTSEASLKSARYIPSIAEIRVRWTNFSTYFSHTKVCENGMKLLQFRALLWIAKEWEIDQKPVETTHYCQVWFLQQLLLIFQLHIWLQAFRFSFVYLWKGSSRLRYWLQRTMTRRC